MKLSGLHLTTASVITWALVVIGVGILIWVCAYVARVASEFGRGIYFVVAVVLAIGLYLGPWFFGVVHAVGIR